MRELVHYASERGLKIAVEELPQHVFFVVAVAGVVLSSPIYVGNLCQALARIDLWTAEEVA